MKYQITLNGKQYEVEVEKGEATATFLGKEEVLQAREKQGSTQASDQQPNQTGAGQDGQGHAVQSGQGHAGQDGPVEAGQPVTAPMPGVILDIQCSQGQKVVAGQVLFILEAMKMENELIAPKDGVVRQLMTGKNQQVETGAVLCLIG